MQWKQLMRHTTWICCVVFIINSGFATPLSLTQAERIALSRSPELKALHAKSEAIRQTSIAVGQFADPKLVVGAINVPTDTFDFNQEAMTQMKVGIQQTFPKGHTLKYRTLRGEGLMHVNVETSQIMRMQILRSVRQSWLDLYYWLHAKQLVLQQKQVFKHLVKVTESLLSNNKAQQKDVIRAELESTTLDNRLINVNQQIDTARYQLARWIGARLAQKANPKRLSSWTLPPSKIQLESILTHHPELRRDTAQIAVSLAGVKLAKQQFKPGFSVGIGYGFRQGGNIDGSKRADFLTAQLIVDMPLFPHNRQDRKLKASEENLTSEHEDLQSTHRQLIEMLKIQYKRWQQLSKSTKLYKHSLIPEAKQYSQATMVAYQNNQTDFPTLARSYIQELNTRLAGVKTVVERGKARVNLLYLEGK